jgi:hypothetical protein
MLELTIYAGRLVLADVMHMRRLPRPQQVNRKRGRRRRRTPWAVLLAPLWVMMLCRHLERVGGHYAVRSKARADQRTKRYARRSRVNGLLAAACRAAGRTEARQQAA